MAPSWLHMATQLSSCQSRMPHDILFGQTMGLFSEISLRTLLSVKFRKLGVVKGLPQLLQIVQTLL
jgi:hypothetical protein